MKTSQISRVWYSDFATKAVQSSDIKRKPDLVLSDHVIELGWNNILLCAELTFSTYQPGGRLANSIDTKAYLLMREQPWRRFVLLLSFSNRYRELRVHLYDRSGGLVSPSFNINTNPDAYLQVLGAIVFGIPECLGYDQTIVFYVTPSARTSHSRRTAVPRKAVTNTTAEEEVRDGEESYSSQAGVIRDEMSETCPPSSSVAGCTDDSGYATYDSMIVSREVEGPYPEAAVFASTTGIFQPEPHVEEDGQEIPTSLFPPSHSNKDPIGKIRVKEKWYDILQVLFYSRGFTGRGTVCYLVRYKDKEFIVKDHWVQGEDSQDVLNEVEMLKRMQDVPGVPHLEDYWVVQRGDGIPDITSDLRYKLYPSTSNSHRTHVRLVLTPCARPLHEFRSKRELVTALRDIVCSRYFFNYSKPVPSLIGPYLSHTSSIRA